MGEIKRFIRDDGIIKVSRSIKELSYKIYEIKEKYFKEKGIEITINELAKIKPKVAGVEQDYTYAEMGDMRLNNMIAKRSALRSMGKSIGTTTGIKDYIKFLQKTRNKQNYQIEIFKNNYLDKMLFAQAYFIGYDQEKIKTIKEKLSKLSNKQFLDAFDNEKLLQMVRDKYPKASEQMDYFVFEEELTMVYDELYNNIDDIVSTYSSA
jgi:RNA polymerase sporulation-specific sigma factor